MNKILKILSVVLISFLTMFSVVNAEQPTYFEETVEEEIEYIDQFIEVYGSEEQYADTVEQYKEYKKILQNADFSNYKESEDKVNIYVFRGSSCGFCLKSIVYFSELLEEYGDYFNLITYEVWSDSDNADLMKQIAEYFEDDANGVPYIVVGDLSLVGYDKSFNSSIEDKIVEQYESKNRFDVMEHLNDKKSSSSNQNVNSILIIIVLIISLGITLYYIYNRFEKVNSRLCELENKIDFLVKNEKTKGQKEKKETKQIKKTAKKSNK